MEYLNFKVLDTTVNCHTAEGPAKLVGLREHLVIANAKRSPLSTMAVKERQSLKHVSLAIRYKQFLLTHGCLAHATSLQGFLEEEAAMRKWKDGTRSTNWGNAIGMARRGVVFGFPSFNPMSDQLFQDARKTVKVAGNRHQPKKPPVMSPQHIYKVIMSLKDPEMVHASTLATLVGGRVSDILQLEIPNLEMLPKVAIDAMSIHFTKGKIVDAVGPYTVGTALGMYMPTILEAMKQPKLFRERTEKQREAFEARMLKSLRRAAPGIGLRTFRNSFAVTLGHNFATLEELQIFLRHSTPQNTMKYLRDGRDYYHGLRQGYTIANRMGSVGSDSFDTSGRTEERMELEKYSYGLEPRKVTKSQLSLKRTRLGKKFLLRKLNGGASIRNL